MRTRTQLPCLLLALLFFCGRSIAFSNDSIPPKKNLSRIKLANGTTIKGYIAGVTDSSISVVSKKDYNRLQYANTTTIMAEDIVGITKNFRNGLTAAKGALGGGGAGVLLGTYLAIKDSCEDHDQDGHCDPGTGQSFSEGVGKAIVFGSVLGTGGAILGLFTRKKDKIYFPINRERNNIRINKLGLGF